MPVGIEGWLGEASHDLVAGNEGEANDVLEVSARATVDGGEIASADPREHRRDSDPTRTEATGSGSIGEAKGAEPRSATSPECRRDSCSSELRQSSLDA